MGYNGRNIAIVVVVLVSLVAVLSLGETQTTLFGGKEVHSPGDWIKEDQIQVFKDRVVLDIQNPIWAGFTDTNSMDPFIDEDAHAIEISPLDADSINIGDVISYQSGDIIIVHRVVEKGEDDKGIYYIVKGDNNRFGDPLKVRFEDVRGVVVAVIY